jgi:hypothetical protein
MVPYVPGTRMGHLSDLRLEVSDSVLPWMCDLSANTCDLFLIVGDIIGCGVDFTQNKVFYTKNGALLGRTRLIPLDISACRQSLLDF